MYLLACIYIQIQINLRIYSISFYYINVIISVKDISVHVTLPDRKVIKVTVAADDIVYAIVRRIKVNTKSNCENDLFLIALIITACFDFSIYIPHMLFIYIRFCRYLVMFAVNLTFI